MASKEFFKIQHLGVRAPVLDHKMNTVLGQRKFQVMCLSLTESFVLNVILFKWYACGASMTSTEYHASLSALWLPSVNQNDLYLYFSCLYNRCNIASWGFLESCDTVGSAWILQQAVSSRSRWGLVVFVCLHIFVCLSFWFIWVVYLGGFLCLFWFGFF